MNNAIKTVIGILIVAAVLVGIFFILPGQVKSPLLQWYQTNFDDQAAMVIEKGKNLKPVQLEEKDPDFKVDSTLDELLRSNSTAVSWYAEALDKEAGRYILHANAYKVTVQYTKQNNDDTSQHFTNEHLELYINATIKNGEVVFEKASYGVNLKDSALDAYGRKKVMEEFEKNVKV